MYVESKEVKFSVTVQRSLQIMADCNITYVLRCALAFAKMNGAYYDLVHQLCSCEERFEKQDLNLLQASVANVKSE
jgi:predicted metal-dependent TIM-barrel fold hydrolase